MATKTQATRKPITSGTKGLICLVVLLALAICASILAVNGMSLDSEGVNVLLPWVPVSNENWPASLPLNRALGGGTYTEYTFTMTDDAADALNNSVKTVRERLVQMGESDAQVTSSGSTIRMELRKMSDSLLASERSLSTMPGKFVFADSTGAEILNEKDIVRAVVNAKRMSSTSSNYTVTLDFTPTAEGRKKLEEADPMYLTVACDGDTVSSYATIGDNGLISASMGLNDTAYRTAANLAFLKNYGTVYADMSQSGTGAVEASGNIVLKVVLWLCALLLVCALVYLVIVGKLTGVSAFLAVWFTVVLAFFFIATAVVPSSLMLNTGCLVAVLLGVVLAIYSAVTRTEAISRQIGEGSTPKQATKVGMKIAAKNVWIAHGAMMVLALLMMIFSFSRSTGYCLSAAVFASAVATLVMRAFQGCFTMLTSKPALFGKTK